MAENPKDDKSSFKMFWGNITFTTEPLWYRLVVISLMLIALVTIIYLLKEWASSSILTKGIKKTFSST